MPGKGPKGCAATGCKQTGFGPSSAGPLAGRSGRKRSTRSHFTVRVPSSISALTRLPIDDK